MSKQIRRFLTIAVLAVFVGYFCLNVDKFRPLAHVNVYLLAIIAIGDVTAIAANGLFIKFILEPFEKRIPTLESVYVSLISSVGNFFAPVGGGFAFRAAYLKKRHGLPYSDYMATLYGNYIVVFLVNAFFGLLSLYLLREKHSSQYFILVMVFAAIFGVSLVLSLVKIPAAVIRRDIKNKYISKFAKILLEMLQGWNRIISNKKLLARLVMLIAFNFALSLLIAKLEIVALHLTISFSGLLLFSVLGSLSLFVSITPANLGVKEAIYLFSSTVIGFSVSQILSIALIDRGVLFLTLVLLWALSSKLRITNSKLLESSSENSK
jgi:uncharacterized protein (TIRG00374 family)